MGIKHRGFTLIEVVLFLGVTGVVMSVLLVGVGAGLNRQKYSDASNSLMSYMQNQYNLVNNVNNSRPATDICSAGSISTGGTAGVSAGRSDCTIVGRYLRAGADSMTIESTQVIATTDAAKLPLSSSDTDAKVLKDAGLILAPTSETYQLSWQTSLVTPKPNQPLQFSMLIVRMPTTGVIHTYVQSGSAPASPAAYFAAATPNPPTADFKLCLSPGGLLASVTEPVGVMVAKNASNSSGVTFVSQGAC